MYVLLLDLTGITLCMRLRSAQTMYESYNSTSFVSTWHFISNLHLCFQSRFNTWTLLGVISHIFRRRLRPLVADRRNGKSMVSMLQISIPLKYIYTSGNRVVIGWNNCLLLFWWQAFIWTNTHTKSIQATHIYIQAAFTNPERDMNKWLKLKLNV